MAVQRGKQPYYLITLFRTSPFKNHEVRFLQKKKQSCDGTAVYRKALSCDLGLAAHNLMLKIKLSIIENNYTHFLMWNIY